MPVSQLEWRAGKTQNKGKGEEEGNRKGYRCNFSLDRGGKTPRKLITTP